MKTENKEIGFTLVGIKTEQFAIFEDNYAPKRQTGLGTELQFKLDQDNNQIGVFTGFEFSQKEKVFLKILVSCHFKIEEKTMRSFIKEHKIIIPKDFMSHLAMITLGTSRGVLFAKTESTHFSQYIVPTLNVSEMISEDAVFDL